MKNTKIWWILPAAAAAVVTAVVFNLSHKESEKPVNAVSFVTESVTASRSVDEEEKETTFSDEATGVSSRITRLIRMFSYEEGDMLLDDMPEILYSHSDGVYDYYTFAYGDGSFTVLQEYDNWKVFDSYRIRNSRDIELICRSFIALYPVHGRDLESYRTAEDMTYEWLQHNIAYGFAEDDDALRESAANVDLDPEEQDMNMLAIYLNHKGQVRR